MATPGSASQIRKGPEGPKGPEGHTRYFTPSKLHYITGRVPNVGGVGSFLHPDEPRGSMTDLIRLYTLQPALFQPRTRSHWGHWDPENPIYPEINDDDQMISTKFGLDSCRNPYFPSQWPSSWKQHVCSLWRLWQRIQDKKMLFNNDLKELLPLLAYGLEDIVGVATSQIEIINTKHRRNKTYPEVPGHGFFGRSCFLSPDQFKVECNASMGFQTPLQFREAMHGKRFFAGFINFVSDMHFTTFIFDRVKGHFAHFDSLNDGQQHKRLTAAVMAFREALNWAGLPFEFDFSGFPLSPQPTGWECGLLSFFSLFMMLRGLVGITGQELYEIYPYDIQLQIDDSEEGQKEPFALYFRDWVLDPWVVGDGLHGINYQRSLRWIAAWFQRVIFDEIGVREGKIWIADLAGGIITRETSDEYITFHETPDQNEPIPVQDLYTDLGGYQPITFKGLGYVPAWEHDRLLFPPLREYRTGRYRTIPPCRLNTTPPFTVTEMHEDLIRWYQEQGAQIEGYLPKKAPAPALLLTISDSEPSRQQSPELGTRTPKRQRQHPSPELGSPTLKRRNQRPSPELGTRTPEHHGLRPSPELGTRTPEHQRDVTPEPGMPPLNPKTPVTALRGLALQTPVRLGTRSSGLTPVRQKVQSKGLTQSKSSHSVYSDYSMSDGPVLGAPSDDGESSDQTRPRRSATTDYGPSIDDAEEMLCLDAAAREEQDEDDGRTKWSEGSKLMSLVPGKKLNPAEVESRVTYRLSTGNWVTHVPPGMIKENQWDDILQAAAGPFLPSARQTLSRSERMREREARKNAEERKNE